MLVFLACLYIVVTSGLTLVGIPLLLEKRQHTFTTNGASANIAVNFFEAVAFVLLWHSSALSYKDALLALMLFTEVFYVAKGLYMVGKTYYYSNFRVAVLVLSTFLNLLVCAVLAAS